MRLLLVIGLFWCVAAHAEGRIVFGIEVPVSIVNVPLVIAIGRMRTAGIDIKTVDFQAPEPMALALQNGDIDVSVTSAGTTFAAVDAGFKGRAFLGLADSDFVMVAKREFGTCASLDGKRVAVQSREGTTGVLNAEFFKTQCPSAKPEILLLPGSENRVAALIAGQIDASPLDSQNAAELLKRRPGVFSVIDAFAKMKILASVFYARTAWLDANKPTVRSFARIYNDVVQDGYAHPVAFIATTKTIVPDMDADLVEQVVQHWVDARIWNPVTGVQPDNIAAAIAFYGAPRPYKRIKTAADVATDEFVQGLN